MHSFSMHSLFMHSKCTVVAFVIFFMATSLAHAELDLSGFDNDLMKMMEETNKYLEPDIVGGNIDNSIEGVQFLREGLKWTEDYFASKGTAKDGEKIAKEGQVLADQVLKALESKDKDTAAASARLLTKNCKACHDIYKLKK